jgi:catechol 2,3-dioxygenase-like lactoylglutathione lyase family enzyme
MMLHHVSIVTADLARSVAFYSGVFGLRQIERPPFPFPGAWFACGTLQLHIIINPDGSFRKTASIDSADTHFALRTEDFEMVIRSLAAKGFREDAVEGDPWRLVVNRNGLAGFPQAFLLDPDRNVIEVNGAP